LTTVRQPARAMGAAAASLLLHVHSLDPPHLESAPVLFEPELVIRGSTLRPS
jgi:DNA-binding LacI/PurR family transcriptional regulator